MNHYNQKNWLQIYGRWFVPILIVALIMIFISSPMGNAAKDFGSLYLNPSIYQDALAKVRQHKEASELLGKPIETLFLMEGEVQYYDNRNVVKMTIPIKGSKAKGRMDIEANKINNNWVYERIRVRVKNPKNFVDIIDPK